jgi:hypothetical protein
MDMSIEKMLSHVYEIEGLMLVTRRLGEENTPDVITNKIQRKVRELAEMCGVTIVPAGPVPEPTVGPAMPPEGTLDPSTAENPISIDSIPEPTVGPAMPPEGTLEPTSAENPISIDSVPEPTVGPAMPPEGALEPTTAEESVSMEHVLDPVVGPVMPPEGTMVPRATEAPVPAEHLPEEDYDADETWQHDNGEEFKEVFALNYEEPSHDVEDPAKVPVEDREPDDDITVEFIEAEDEPAVEPKPVDEPAEPVTQPRTATPVPPIFRNPEESDEPVPDPDPAVVPEALDEPDIMVEFIEADDDVVPEPEDEMPMPPLPTEFPEVEDEPIAPIRVDEKLQRSLSKDIRKAFSLNDRFRFQRELFAGSANAMDTAIEHIEMMSSYGNAELYFFSQLHWDRDNEVVQDFMNIVRNHFQK